MRTVLDTSALAAFLFQEPDGGNYLKAVQNAAGLVLSAVTLFETRTVVLGRYGVAASEELDQLMQVLAVTIAPFDEEQAEAASIAYTRYGKGRGHKAQLNLGDCASYALAKSLDAPLLFKGQDFSHTDIIAALPLLVPEAGISQ
jgi:ribonuclease VapC